MMVSHRREIINDLDEIYRSLVNNASEFNEKELDKVLALIDELQNRIEDL